MADFRKQVELEVKDTIGYSEAEDKKSFMTGVGVAISRLEEKYEREINQLRTQLEYADKAEEVYKKDLLTLSSIMDKYSTRGE